MNSIREIVKINKEELERGIAGTSASWHEKYVAAAWVYAGNLDHELSEGDIICVMSQYGEVEDIHLPREEDTGKSRGFAFVKYEDARSCVLAVDNLVGVQLLGRPIRVDHVENYRLPKKILEAEGKEGAPNLDAGHAYKDAELKNNFDIHKGQDLFVPVDQGSKEIESKSSDGRPQKRKHDDRKKKQSKRKHGYRKQRKRHKREESEDSDEVNGHRRTKKQGKSQRKRRRRSCDRTVGVSDQNGE